MSIQKITLHSKAVSTVERKDLHSATTEISNTLQHLISRILEVNGTIHTSSHSVSREGEGIYNSGYRGSAIIVFSVPEGTDVSNVS